MEILFRFSVAFAALLLQSSFALQYREHKFFHGGKYNLSLVKDPSTGDLHFQAVAETLGWVGFGIAAKNTSMQEMDCIVAGVKNGVGYINDFYSNQIGRPTQDTTGNHYTLNYAAEVGSTTTIRFHRPSNLTNDHDFKFTPGKEAWLAWAYHDSVDGDDPNTFPKHTFRGYTPQSGRSGTVDLLPHNTTSTSATPTTGTPVNPSSKGAWTPHASPLLLLVTMVALFASN